jgi:hypothetical protein
MEQGLRRLRSCLANMSPGGPGLTVRPYYEGLPLAGLDAGRMKAGESLPDRGGECLSSVPGSTVPGPKIAAVERRKACALLPEARAAAPLRGGGFETAPFGVPLPQFREGHSGDIC